MSGTLTHSPSQIVRQLLVDLEQGVLMSELGTGSWPITAGQWPDEVTGMDSAIFVQGTEGQTQGRSMLDGYVFEKHGITVHIRDTRYADGRTKANAIARALDTTTLTSVTIDESVYVVSGFHRSGDVLELGKEDGTSRHLFNVNGFLTVRQSD